MPKVSILVPVYKTENYLRQCLDSLINQTLEDIEIICVNDGSPDSCPAILEEYAEKDPRIKIVNKENGGLPSARNAGLDVATGEYVGFVDSDDFIDVKMYEKMYEKAIKTDSDIVVCGAKVLCDEKTEDYVWYKNALTTPNKLIKEATPNAIFDYPALTPFVWRDLVRRSLIEENNIRLKTDIVLGEDVAFQFKAFPKAKKICMIKGKYYNYRLMTSSSIMKSFNLKYRNRINSHLKLIDHVFDVWKTEGYLEGRESFLIDWANKLLMFDLMKFSLFERLNVKNRLYEIYEKNGVLSHSLKRGYSFDFFNLITYKGPTPKLSVLVASSYGEQSLVEQIKSVALQTYNELEIIVAEPVFNLNIANYCKKDDRIVYLADKKYADLNTVRNLAINVACGEHIMFLNDAKLSQPKALEILMKNNKSDIIIGVEEDYLSKIENAPSKIVIEDFVPDLEKNCFIFSTSKLLNENLFFKNKGVLDFVEFYLNTFNAYGNQSVIRGVFVEKLNLISSQKDVKTCLNMLNSLIEIENGDVCKENKKYAKIVYEYFEKSYGKHILCGIENDKKREILQLLFKFYKDFQYIFGKETFTLLSECLKKDLHFYNRYSNNKKEACAIQGGAEYLVGLIPYSIISLFKKKK